MITMTWDEPSALWLRDLPRFAELVVPGLQGAVGETLLHALGEMRPRVPVFERTLQEDLAFTVFPRRMGRGVVMGSVGFTDATLIDEIENYGEATEGQFSVARGKDTGIEPHKVFLYNYKTGETTAARAKLIRYLKQKNAAVYGELPDKPGKEWFRHHHLKPWVEVAPQHTEFMQRLVQDNGDPLASFLIERVYEAVGRQWAGAG